MSDPVPIWGRIVAWSLARAIAFLGLAIYVLALGVTDRNPSSAWPVVSSLLTCFVLAVPWREIGVLAHARPGKLRAMIRVAPHD